MTVMRDAEFAELSITGNGRNTKMILGYNKPAKKCDRLKLKLELQYEPWYYIVVVCGWIPTDDLLG